MAAIVRDGPVPVTEKADGHSNANQHREREQNERQGEHQQRNYAEGRGIISAFHISCLHEFISGARRTTLFDEFRKKIGSFREDARWSPIKGCGEIALASPTASVVLITPKARRERLAARKRQKPQETRIPKDKPTGSSASQRRVTFFCFIWNVRRSGQFAHRVCAWTPPGPNPPKPRFPKTGAFFISFSVFSTTTTPSHVAA
jgi:hypothetical protein